MTQTETNLHSQDDLILIDGIGNATARRIKESLGVDCVQELIALSPEAIEDGLKGSGRKISREQIEEWMEHARRICDTHRANPEQATNEGLALSERDSGAHPNRAGWEPFASFVVEFQSRRDGDDVLEQRTSVHHLEADKDDQWPGIDSDRLCRWMLSRVHDELSRGPQRASSVEMSLETSASDDSLQHPTNAESANRPSVSVEITEIRAVQSSTSGDPPVIGASGRSSHGFVAGGEPVTFELSLQLSGPDAAEIARRHTRIDAEVYALNRDTAQTRYLANTEPERTKDGKLTYTALIPDAVLERGTYRLHCVASLEGKPPHQGFLKVPVLEVV